jgi:hypothetical protein
MSDDVENIPPIRWKYYKKHAKIRMAVVYIMHDIIGFSRKRCPMKYLVDSLNAIVGPKANKDYTIFTEMIVRNAFCHDKNDSLVRCSDITDDPDHVGILHVRWGRQGSHIKSDSSDQYVYDFCLFQNMQSAIEGQNNAGDARVMTKTMINEVDANIVPKELKR